MSKRYGRQQKLKAKAEILVLEKIIESRNWEIKNLLGQTLVARNIVELVREVSPNSIVFEPAEAGAYRQRIHAPMEPALLSSDLDLSGYELVDLNFIDMYKLEAGIKHDAFEKSVHFLCDVYSGSNLLKCAAYTLSKEAFESKHSKEIMALEIAKALVAHLKS